jgi:uncharacterized DUF497 family protein
MIQIVAGTAGKGNGGIFRTYLDIDIFIHIHLYLSYRGLLMNYEWDPAKNMENIRKHKVSFEQAITAIEDPHRLFLYDEAHSQNEDRYIMIGNAEGRILFVNGVEINEITTRIISARRAKKKEMEAYYGNCALYFGNRS